MGQRDPNGRPSPEAAEQSFQFPLHGSSQVILCACKSFRNSPPAAMGFLCAMEVEKTYHALSGLAGKLGAVQTLVSKLTIELETNESFSLAPLGERGSRKAGGEGVGPDLDTVRRSRKSKSKGRREFPRTPMYTR